MIPIVNSYLMNDRGEHHNSIICGKVYSRKFIRVFHEVLSMWIYMEIKSPETKGVPTL